MKSNSNILQISQETGLSTATVSRVLSGKSCVSKKTQEIVLRAAKAMNYVPKSSSPLTRIPVFLEDFHAYAMGMYECLMIAHLTRLLAEKSCLLELVPVEEEKVLGCMLSKASLSLVYSFEARRILEERSFPLITFNNPMKRAINIYSDHYEEGYLATEHLLKLGHRRIGLCISCIEGWGRNERMRGYQEALQAAGVPCDPQLMMYDNNDPTLLRAVTLLLRRKVTAIVGIGHDIGIRVAHALYLLNKRVPEDISVVSTENQLLGTCTVPPQTACVQPLQTMAEAAVQKIVELLGGQRVKHEDLVFSNTLLCRESTRSL